MAQLVTVCIPARNEARGVGAVVETFVSDPLVLEVIVVDDGSTDRTGEIGREAGARVIRADDVLARWAKSPGKGQAMWKGVSDARGDVVVFCDADVEAPPADMVTRLVTPLLHDSTLVMVKATYTRMLNGRRGEGGRVTELVARPLLAMLFPDLAHLRQPLAGEYAVRRTWLEQLPFVTGYGVDLALLVDIAAAAGAGPEAIVEVDLGTRVHRNRPLAELGPQAAEVLAAGLARAGVPGIAVTECPPLSTIGA